jgi:protein tyrosine phosphatase
MNNSEESSVDNIIAERDFLHIQIAHMREERARLIQLCSQMLFFATLMKKTASQWCEKDENFLLTEDGKLVVLQHSHL